MLYRLCSLSEFVKYNHNTLELNFTHWSQYQVSTNKGWCLFDDAEVPVDIALQMLHTKYSVIMYFSDNKADLHQARATYNIDRDTEVYVHEYGTSDLCKLHVCKAHRILFGNKVQKEVDLYA